MRISSAALYSRGGYSLISSECCLQMARGSENVCYTLFLRILACATIPSSCLTFRGKLTIRDSRSLPRTRSFLLHVYVFLAQHVSYSERKGYFVTIAVQTEHAHVRFHSASCTVVIIRMIPKSDGTRACDAKEKLCCSLSI